MIHFDHREEVFTALKESSVPIIYDPMDAFPYKIELKHESWRNTEKLLKSGAKFSVMSDHPVILQRNILYSLRHILRFGLSRATEYVKTALPVVVIYHITLNKLVSYAIESATSRYHIIVTKLAIVFLSSLLPFFKMHKFTYIDSG